MWTSSTRQRTSTTSRTIVAKYGINYIIVGSLEREVYSQAALEKFDGMFPKVYPAAGTESNVAIYQVRQVRRQGGARSRFPVY